MIETVMCLAMAVYFEARGEPPQGQTAVAQVVMNRVSDSRYPDNVCDVVKQGRYAGAHPLRDQCQFSFWCDGKKETIYEKRAWGEAVFYATIVYFGLVPDVTDGATHYHTTEVHPVWSRAMDITLQIDNHIFYRGEQ